MPDAIAPVVVNMLDVFCYFGLPKHIHTDQGVQFEAQLMTELCMLWNVEKTHTAPCHPPFNGIV